MSPDRKVRIGIDVGGTFTHAVAIDAQTLKLVGKTKVPTTHRAQEGVALGIIESLKALLQETNLKAEQVAFIAHSTTQATNALLEGDVAAVGVIGMGGGPNKFLAMTATDPKGIKLAPGKFLKLFHEFVDTEKPLEKAELVKVFQSLKDRGAQAFAISEAFSVDAPQNERLALSVAQEMGLSATIGSDISQLYGLRIRTRTAILNAAMLPKMLESAELTERCVKDFGIAAPLMIMRSDGGVMDLPAVRKKPILTMLSGPAAGVAAALMYLKISDGIFIEVGGTSTDISAIHNGRSQIRSAEIGRNKLLMKTLDVRTVGVAGGSLARIGKDKIVEAGPRSAHIAGFKYVAFADVLRAPTVSFRAPLAGDPDSYILINDESSSDTLCLTPTCAANLLGYVPPKDCAAGNLENIAKAFEALGKKVGKSAAECAEEFLSRAADKCLPIVQQLIEEAKLDEKTVTLYGGGGGAAALVPYLAKNLNLNFELAESADVISAIGVALALVRETIERQVVSPSNDDILRIREDAQIAVEIMGAEPSTIDVFVEFDAQKSILRATASGATSSTTSKIASSYLNEDERLDLLSRSMRMPKERIKKEFAADNFDVYFGEKKLEGLARFFGQTERPLRVIDKYGSIRFQCRHGDALKIVKADTERTIKDLANRWARWGDAGKTVPNIVVLAGSKIIDLSGLADIEQIASLAKAEVDRFPADAPLIVLATPN
jgi:N-methylhydantoinase A/oxoprolinase/acetone carboxylase beta subunit